MSAWRDRLLPASFRGVAFGVTKASDEVGRRTVRHDYPQRDDPYVEDMGRAPRVINITGFVLGGDYMVRRDRLQAALDTPGPGTLVHPWYGSVTVALMSARVEQSATDGGMAVFTMAFVRVDNDTRTDRPAPRADHVSMAVSRAEAAAALVQDILDGAIALNGVIDYVVSQPLDALLSGLSSVGDIIGLDLTSSTGWLRNVTGSATALYNMFRAGTFGASLRRLFSDAGSGSLSGSGGIAPNPDEFFAAAKGLQAAPVPEAGITRTSAAQNAAAVTNAIKQFTTIEALLGTASTAPGSRDEAQHLRGEVVEAVDAVIAALPSTPEGDAAIAAFEDLRSSVLLALAEHAGQTPDISTITLARSLPSLVVSWRYTGDLAAEDDIVTRNGVGHPGFVPAARNLELVHD